MKAEVSISANPGGREPGRAHHRGNRAVASARPHARCLAAAALIEAHHTASGWFPLSTHDHALLGLRRASAGLFLRPLTLDGHAWPNPSRDDLSGMTQGRLRREQGSPLLQ